MPIDGGGISIHTPSSGAEVVVGATFRVAGRTQPATVTKNDEVINKVWPNSVTISLDGGPAQPARALAAEWAAWEAMLRVTSPGPHTVVVVAEWRFIQVDRAEATITINGVATPLDLIDPPADRAVTTVGF